MVIGCIDSYGAIHHRPVYINKLEYHESLWPTNTHKRWRFNLCDWSLDRSILSKEIITPEEAEDIEALIRKHYKVPLWVQEGDEWEALGRPRSGKAYQIHCRKWDKIRKNLP